MATISRNFGSIVIEEDGSTLRVTGTTVLVDNGTETLAEEPDGVALYVSIVGLPDKRGPLVAPATVASSGSAWTARFPNTATKVEDQVTVHVVGLALHEDFEPFVWEEVLDLLTQASVPDDA